VIFIDNTFEPLAVVGVLPEDATVPPEFGCDEGQLWANRTVLFTLVVPGSGPRALAAYRELLQWLQRHQRLVRQRSCAFAWVIEDEMLRACVGAWLVLTRDAASAPCTEVFQAIRLAFSWLAEGSRRRPSCPGEALGGEWPSA
jgi:hypothetical protein